MDYFPQIFQILMGAEGGFTNNSADPGNWTGGAVGAGVCKGTKYGISASAYPSLDIKNLTLEDAAAIYRRDYWGKVQGDAMPPRLAMLVFDAAVNNGVERSVKFLQASLGVGVDGILGGETVDAVAHYAATDITPVCSEVVAQRINFMANDPNWKEFGLGWARRLAALPWKVMQIGAPAPA